MEDIQGKAKIDLSNRMAIVKNDLDLEKVKKENQDESDFWTRELKRAAADPANIAYQAVQKSGKADAKKLIDSAMDPNDKNHDLNWGLFKNVYNLDTNLVEKDLTAKVAREMGEGPFQFQDINYEHKIKQRYKKSPTTSLVEVKLHENFCAALDKKWKQVGYNGDTKFVSEYCAKYGIEPNMQIDELAKFLPKP